MIRNLNTRRGWAFLSIWITLVILAAYIQDDTRQNGETAMNIFGWIWIVIAAGALTALEHGYFAARRPQSNRAAGGAKSSEILDAELVGDDFESN